MPVSKQVCFTRVYKTGSYQLASSKGPLPLHWSSHRTQQTNNLHKRITQNTHTELQSQHHTHKHEKCHTATLLPRTTMLTFLRQNILFRSTESIISTYLHFSRLERLTLNGKGLNKTNKLTHC